MYAVELCSPKMVVVAGKQSGADGRSQAGALMKWTAARSLTGEDCTVPGRSFQSSPFVVEYMW